MYKKKINWGQLKMLGYQRAAVFAWLNKYVKHIGAVMARGELLTSDDADKIYPTGGKQPIVDRKLLQEALGSLATVFAEKHQSKFIQNEKLKLILSEKARQTRVKNAGPNGSIERSKYEDRLLDDTFRKYKRKLKVLLKARDSETSAHLLAVERENKETSEQKMV